MDISKDRGQIFRVESWHYLRPLLLYASSSAQTPAHRHAIHLESVSEKLGMACTSAVALRSASLQRQLPRKAWKTVA